MRPRILIVDDVDALRGDLCEVVSTLVPGCAIELTGNQQEAIRLIKEKLFPLVITDIDLHESGGTERGGFEVLEAAKERDPAIQVIVITSFPRPEHVRDIRALGGFGYVDRAKYIRRDSLGAADDGYEYWRELLGYEARDALEEHKLAKVRLQPVVTIVVPEGSRQSLEIVGSRGKRLKTRRLFDLDRPLLKNAAAGIGSMIGRAKLEEFNSLSQFAGLHLWERMFGDHGEALLTYGEALGCAAHPSHVTIRIQSGPEDLDIPFELLHSPLELLHDDAGYMGLRHPLLRVAPGSLQTPHRRTWDGLLEDLRDFRELRMLLIASDPGGASGGAIPKVDEEIEAVAAAAREFGIKPTVIHSPEASRDRVREELERRWHVIHYAGHGSFSSHDPQNSGIHFRGGTMYTAELSQLLEKHPPSLLYLNCCHSARAGIGDCLTYSKSLGLADAVVRAGVPAVVCHRWPVPDNDTTVAFVESFYRKLLCEYPPERALLSARRAIQQKDTLDSAWSSAVMIVQES